jgi:hypothetical protein
MTLEEHIDALDRMVDGGSPKPELRSQIAFIGREVTAFAADYSKLQEAYVALEAKYAKLEEEHLHPARSFSLIPPHVPSDGVLPSEGCL